MEEVKGGKTVILIAWGGSEKLFVKGSICLMFLNLIDIKVVASAATFIKGFDGKIADRA